jgi:hypothetical protein
MCAISGGGGSITRTVSLPIPSGKLELDEGLEVVKVQPETSTEIIVKAITIEKTFFMIIILL